MKRAAHCYAGELRNGDCSMEVFNQKWEKVYRWVLAYIDRNKFSGNLKMTCGAGLLGRNFLIESGQKEGTIDAEISKH